MNPSYSNTRSDAQREVAQADIQCPSCGKNGAQTSMVDDPFVYGEGSDAVELVARVPLRTCAACGFEFLDSEAEDAQHEAVCRHLGVLTPSEIRALREKHGFSRAAFSQLTKLGEATIARWERGALIQNSAYDQFMYLLQDPRNLERLRERLERQGEEGLPALQETTKPRFRVLEPSQADRERAASFKLNKAA